MPNFIVVFLCVLRYVCDHVTVKQSLSHSRPHVMQRSSYVGEMLQRRTLKHTTHQLRVRQHDNFIKLAVYNLRVREKAPVGLTLSLCNVNALMCSGEFNGSLVT